MLLSVSWEQRPQTSLRIQDSLREDAWCHADGHSSVLRTHVVKGEKGLQRFVLGTHVRVT